MLINFPSNLKFKKTNRSSFFNINKSTSFNFNPLLRSGYAFGLFALSNAFISKSQIEMLFFLVKKIIKDKRTLGSNNKSRLNLVNSKFLTENLNFEFFCINEKSTVAEKSCLFFLHSISNKKYFIKQIQRFLKTHKKFKKLRFFATPFNLISSTLKPIGVRMGRGKGEPKKWHSQIKYGQCLIQLRKDVKPFKAFLALTQLKYRLSFKTFIYFSNPRSFLTLNEQAK